jgi:hypothetical protein
MVCVKNLAQFLELLIMHFCCGLIAGKSLERGPVTQGGVQSGPKNTSMYSATANLARALVAKDWR